MSWQYPRPLVQGERTRVSIGVNPLVRRVIQSWVIQAHRGCPTSRRRKSGDTSTTATTSVILAAIPGRIFSIMEIYFPVPMDGARNRWAPQVKRDKAHY